MKQPFLHRAISVIMATNDNGQNMISEKEKMKQLFNCNDSNSIKEYIGTKVNQDRNDGSIMLI